jgi:hypothetical protein
MTYSALRATDATGRALPARLVLRPGQLRIVVDDAGATYPVTIDPYIAPLPTPVATFTGASSYEYLGSSVALSTDGRTALMGAPNASTGSGAAYLYSEAGDTWSTTPAATFTGSSSEELGYSVALSAGGQVALLGAPGASNDNGAAYVYSESGGTWSTTPAATFTGSSSEELGYSVALSADGQVALVGAWDAGANDNGAGYLYSEAGGTWSNNPTATFTGSSNERLGSSVALSADGQTALVGAPDSSSSNGATYLYSETGGTWSNTPAETFTANSPEEHFGSSVALSAEGQVALMGAPYAVDGHGAAYVYSEAGGTWSNTPAASFTTSSSEEHLGGSVALSADGQVALVGAPGASSGNGVTSVYSEAGGTWSTTPAATFSGSSSEELGYSVALSASGEAALVGAPYAEADENGAAYLYSAPTVTVDVSGSQTYGSSSPIFSYTDDAPSGLTVSGTLTCTTVDGGTSIRASLAAGTHTLDGSSCSGLSLSGTDASAYSISYTGVTDGFVVSKANQTITFTSTNPSPVTVGGATYTPTATATSGLTVSFTIDGSSTSGACSISAGVVSFAGAGTCVVDANQAGNTNWNAAPQVQQSVTVTVSKANQTITFTSTNPSPVTVGGATYTPTATATSGLTVSFTIDGSSTSGACSISAGVVSFAGAGTCVVDANQAGNTNWNAAPQVQQSITVTVSKANQTITFTLLVKHRSLAQPPLIVHASASSGLTVSFSTSTPSVCTAKQVGGGAVVALHRPGTCIVVASQAGNASYAPAPPVRRSFTVSKAGQTIKFAPLPNQAPAGSTITVRASASSGLTVSFTTTTPLVCTLVQTRAGARLSLLRAGKCTVVAHQAGNATYSAAAIVGRSFTVSARLTT